MGSVLTIKPGRSNDGPYNGRENQRYSPVNRNEYSRDQDGYPEKREKYGNKHYQTYNYNNSDRQEEQYPCRLVFRFIFVLY